MTGRWIVDSHADHRYGMAGIATVPPHALVDADDLHFGPVCFLCAPKVVSTALAVIGAVDGKSSRSVDWAAASSVPPWTVSSLAP